MILTLNGSRLMTRAEAIRRNYDGVKPLYVCGESVMPWVIVNNDSEITDISEFTDVELERVYDFFRRAEISGITEEF